MALTAVSALIWAALVIDVKDRSHPCISVGQGLPCRLALAGQALSSISRSQRLLLGNGTGASVCSDSRAVASGTRRALVAEIVLNPGKRIMNGSTFLPRSIRKSLGGGLGLALLLAAPVLRRARRSLGSAGARFVPSEGLAILLEHNGLDSRPEAWKGTAAYKMLNETPLGAMLEDITAQLVEGSGDAGRPVTARRWSGCSSTWPARGSSSATAARSTRPSRRRSWW